MQRVANLITQYLLPVHAPNLVGTTIVRVFPPQSRSKQFFPALCDPPCLSIVNVWKEMPGIFETSLQFLLYLFVTI